MTLQEKVSLLERSYCELAKAYHRVSGIGQPGKHTSADWKECKDQPCQEYMTLLTMIQKGEVLHAKES